MDRPQILTTTRRWTVFLITFVAVSAVGQDSLVPRVAIPLIVTDSHHRPTTLTINALTVSDQKMPVGGATLVPGTDLPLELGILIDDSNSERSADLNDILSAARGWVSQSLRTSNDRVFVVKFDMEPQATGWMNREQWAGVQINLRVGGGTTLYDAIAMACTDRMGPTDWRKPTRRVLVLISDGEDNMSRLTRDEAVSRALKAGVVIFTIDTDLSGMSYKGVKTMQHFAEVTGGESFTQVSRKDAPKVFATISDMLDSLHYLRYALPDASNSGLHEVNVQRTSKDKLKLSYPREYWWNP